MRHHKCPCKSTDPACDYVLNQLGDAPSSVRPSQMRFLSLALLPAFALGQSQVYLSPADPQAAVVSVSPEEARDLVAHQLSLSRFVRPSSSSPSRFLDVLQSVFSVAQDPFQQDTPASKDSFLLLYHGPQEVIPDQQQQQLRPVLRATSPEENSVQDWEAYLTELFQQSAAWFDSGLGQLWQQAIHSGRHAWDEVTTPVQPKEAYSRLLSEYDFAQTDATPLLKDIEAMSNLVDQAEAATTSWALRLTGLAEYEASKPSANELQQARNLYKQTLEATMAAYRARTSPASKITLIHTEASASPRTRRTLQRRQETLLPLASAARNVTPVVPASKMCFATYESCMESTGGCSSHGACVAAVQAGSTSSCFACSCSSSSKANGASWSGERCEKQNVASSFWLLVGTTLLLVVTVGVSVGLLSQAGGEELPQVLSQ